MEQQGSVEGSQGPEVAGGPDAGATERSGQQSTSEWSAEHAEEPSAFDAVRSWAAELFGEASDVIARPGDFFAGLPQEGGLGRATVFAVVMGAVAGILGFLLRVLPAWSAIVTTPFAAFAYTVVGTFLIHVLAMLAGGKGALDGSYRLAAYLTVFLPLVVVASILPYLNIAMAGYGLYALIMGVIPVHGLEERRAWSVFGAAGAVGLLVLLVATVAGRSSPTLEELDAHQRQAVERLEQQIEQLQQQQTRQQE